MKTLSQVINEAFFEASIKFNVNVETKLSPRKTYHISTTDEDLVFDSWDVDGFTAKIVELKQNGLQDLTSCGIKFNVEVKTQSNNSQVLLERRIYLEQNFKNGKPTWSSATANDMIVGVAADDTLMKQILKKLEKEYEAISGIKIKLDANAYKNL